MRFRLLEPKGGAPASERDLEAVRGLFREWFAELDPLMKASGVRFDSFQDTREELDGLPGKYARAEGGFLVLAEDEGGAVAGCVAMRHIRHHLNGERVAEMKRLFVGAAHRRLGLGRRLALRALDLAKAAGVRTLYLDTLARLGPANGLYRSLGFEPCEAYVFNPVEDARYFSASLDAHEADPRSRPVEGA